MTRSADQVLRDHLDRRKHHDVDGDLAHNYADDVVVLSKDGAWRGRDGIKHTAATLHEWLPDAEYSYHMVRTDGELALLSWSARAPDGGTVCGGCDSFVIRDGQIIGQTIHYTVKTDHQGRR